MLLKAPVAGGAMSHRGVEYIVDDQGFVEIPDEEADELREILGFTVAPKPIEKPPATKKAK